MIACTEEPINDLREKLVKFEKLINQKNSENATLKNQLIVSEKNFQ